MLYLNGKMKQFLAYHSKGYELLMYVDWDYAGDTEDRKLMSGSLAKIANATVHWGAQMHITVALSAYLAEYCAIQLMHKTWNGF